MRVRRDKICDWSLELESVETSGGVFVAVSLEG